MQQPQIAGRIECNQLVFPLRPKRRQLGRRSAVTAGQAYPCGQALVQLAQALGLKFGAVQIAAQRVASVLQLRLGALQHLDHRCQRRVEAGHFLQGVGGPCSQRFGVVVGLADGVQRGACRVDQRLRVGQALVFCAQRGPLGFARCELVDLANLPAQPLAFAGHVGMLALRLLERVSGASQLRPRLRQRCGLHARVGVEQGAHRDRAREALPCMLAVNVHQVIASFAQLRQGGSAAVDPSAALALSVDVAAQQQGVAGVEACQIEPFGQRRRRVKFGGDFSAHRTFAHHARVTPAAKGQLQRVNQDRLAGAGFTCQHHKASAHIDFERCDDHKVTQRQTSEHRVVGGLNGDLSGGLNGGFNGGFNSLKPRRDSNAVCRAAWRSSSNPAGAKSEPDAPSGAP